VPTGAARVLDPVAARGARVVAFTAMQGQTAQVMAWNRRTGSVAAISRGNAPSEDASISDDGRRIAFVSAATNLDPKQTDGSRAIYVRDRTAKTTRVVSDTTAAYPKGVLKPPAVKPAPAPAPAATPVDAPGDDVLVTDNAFVHDGDRPTVTLDAGSRLTWDFQSRQSHAITVRAGPVRFAWPALNSKAVSHEFDEPGTYDIVCSLHAPGMRMTVVVR
jgi:plastocyanin